MAAPAGWPGLRPGNLGPQDFGAFQEIAEFGKAEGAGVVAERVLFFGALLQVFAAQIADRGGKRGAAAQNQKVDGAALAGGCTGEFFGVFEQIAGVAQQKLNGDRQHWHHRHK